MSLPPHPFEVIASPAGGDLGLIHVTAIAEAATDDSETLEALFLDLRARVEAAHGEVVQEKLFVSQSGADAVLAARTGAGAAVVPPTVVVAEPVVGGLLAGVQLLVATQGRCETIHDGPQPVGRLWERDGLRMLALAGIHGPVDRPVPEQMEAMFARAGELVEANGFEFQQVARTWIYVAPLLEFYDDLNRIRDRFFRSRGLLSPHSHPPPASTGIQGGHPRDAACQMDLVALSGDPRLTVEPMRTSHQCEAYDYGSSFSRGMTVRFGGERLLYASGTASIDDKGQSVHVGDSPAQNRETFAAMDTLLGHQGVSLAGAATTGVLFLKGKEDARAWAELLARDALPQLPVIAVYADVCRPELLVELEITAAG